MRIAGRLEESSYHIFSSSCLFLVWIERNHETQNSFICLTRNAPVAAAATLFVSMAATFLKCSERKEWEGKKNNQKNWNGEILAVHCFNTNAHAIPVAYHYGIVRSVEMKWQKSCTFFPFVNIIILVVVGYCFSHLFSGWCVMAADVHWHKCLWRRTHTIGPKWAKRQCIGAFELCLSHDFLNRDFIVRQPWLSHCIQCPLCESTFPTYSPGIAMEKANKKKNNTMQQEYFCWWVCWAKRQWIWRWKQTTLHLWVELLRIVNE